MTEAPSQSHSDTSVGSAKSMSRKRLLSQEKWVYDILRVCLGKADWELWEIAQYYKTFDQKSSLHRARIGLMWRSRSLGATPWHPVEDSGRRNKDPQSNKPTVIWRLKSRYQDMPYEQWAKEFRRLAKGKPDDV